MRSVVNAREECFKFLQSGNFLGDCVARKEDGGSVFFDLLLDGVAEAETGSCGVLLGGGGVDVAKGHGC